MAIKKWKLAELTAVFVERSLNQATNVTVEHDVRIADRLTGALRQVDVAIRYSQGGYNFLRTVEVQDRGAKIGSDAIDQFVTKADRLGAHRTTLVSAVGFTGPALDRIAESQVLDAVRLSPLRYADRPPIFQNVSDADVMDDTRKVLLKKAEPEFWAYKRLSDSETRYVQIYDLSIPATDAAGAVIVDPMDLNGGSDTARLFVAALVKPGSNRQLNRFGITLTHKDGRQTVLQAVARAPSTSH